jgi:hypothetical protein
MWMALGDRGLLYKVLRAAVPGLGMMRFPIKFIVLAAFVLPLLAAYGWQSVLARSDAHRRVVVRAAAAIALLIAGLVVYNELNPFRSSVSSTVAWNATVRVFFLCLAAALLLPRGEVFRQLSLPLLVALTAMDGLTHTTWQNPVAPSWVYQKKIARLQPLPQLGVSRAMISPEAAERMDHLKLDSPAEDVLASRIGLYCNLNLLERIPKVDGFYSLYPRALAELQDALYAGLERPAPGILDFLGVTRITSPGSWNEWDRRESALPLVTAPAAIRIAERPLTEMLRGSFNPREIAFLAGQESTNGPCAIQMIEWKPHWVRFECDAARPARLVISQTFYFPWQAAVDGAPVEIERANYAFQSIAVPAGRHVVELRYVDRAFAFGRIVSIISAVGVIAGLFVFHPRRKCPGMLGA